jgi:hypothetical protein
MASVVDHHANAGIGVGPELAGAATAYAQLHDSETALRWLSQAARTGFPCYPWYARDPLLYPIRDDSRFADFMRDLRRSWKDARAKYSRGSSGRRTSQGN